MGVHWYEILERKVQADGSKRGAADLLKLVTFDVKSGVGGHTVPRAQLLVPYWLLRAKHPPLSFDGLWAQLSTSVGATFWDPGKEGVNLQA